MLHQGQLCSFWQLLVTVLFEQLFQTPEIESRSENSKLTMLKTGYCPQCSVTKDVFF